MITKIVKTENFGKFVTFELNNIYEAIYALKNPIKMYKIDSLQNNKDVQQLRNKYNDKSIPFNKMRLQVFNNKIAKENIIAKKLIYTNRNKYYPVILVIHNNHNGGFEGGHTKRPRELLQQSFIDTAKKIKKIDNMYYYNIFMNDYNIFTNDYNIFMNDNNTLFLKPTRFSDFVVDKNLFEMYLKNANTFSEKIRSPPVKNLQSGGGDNVFDTILSFCDTIHDFNKHYTKDYILQEYEKNTNYMKSYSKLLDRENFHILQLRNLCISQRNISSASASPSSASVSSSDVSASSSANIQKAESDKETEAPPSGLGWEAMFLSRFYYSMMDHKEHQRVYKLNIKNETYAEKFAEYLNKHKYTQYFFDTGISGNIYDDTFDQYSFRELINKLENKNITQFDTVAKWWDPSSGGNQDIDYNQLQKFSEILKKEIMIDDEFILNNITTSNVVYSSNVEISVPKEGFTINKCREGIEQEPKTLNPMNYYDLKRSGDHGQVMYMKHLNENRIDEKIFLITGDAMCAVKAMYEKQPVLFKKYHGDLRRDRYVDLYFYNPFTANLSREYLLLQNKHLLNQGDIKIEKIVIEINSNSRVYYEYTLESFVKNKFTIKIQEKELEQEQIHEKIDTNYRELADIFHHVQFVVDFDNYKSQIEEYINEINTADNTYTELETKMEQTIHKIQRDYESLLVTIYATSTERSMGKQVTEAEKAREIKIEQENDFFQKKMIEVYHKNLEYLNRILDILKKYRKKPPNENLKQSLNLDGQYQTLINLIKNSNVINNFLQRNSNLLIVNSVIDQINSFISKSNT